MATIANTDELIEAITSLETSVTLPEGTVSSKMDATEINTLMQGIEDVFEKLYEKLRVLEDLHDFTKKYIEKNINVVAARMKKWKTVCMNRFLLML